MLALHALNSNFAQGLEYLILWKGYRNENSSWIKESDLNLAAKRYVSYKLYMYIFLFLFPEAFNTPNQDGGL